MRVAFIILLSLVNLCFVFSQKRTIDVGSFTSVSLGINGTLHLSQGTDEQVVIDCSDEDFEKIEFEYSSDKLWIKRKNNRSWKGENFRDVDIYITMKELSKVTLSGAGDIKGKTKFDTEELTVVISGSGNIDMAINSTNVESKISGSGSIELAGSADEVGVRISGSGKIKAEDLTTKRFEASISGSGSCYVTVTEEINASISGSGNVYYAGNPDRVIGNSSGSGKLKKM